MSRFFHSAAITVLVLGACSPTKHPPVPVGQYVKAWQQQLRALYRAECACRRVRDAKARERFASVEACVNRRPKRLVAHRCRAAALRHVSRERRQRFMRCVRRNMAGVTACYAKCAQATAETKGAVPPCRARGRERFRRHCVTLLPLEVHQDAERCFRRAMATRR